jgi:hypothetical protein
MRHDPATVAEVFETNLGGGGVSDFELQRVKVPGSGGIHWAVERLSGEESVKEITGVIVASRVVRLYWARSIDETGGGDAPDCTSEDGDTGVGTPGGVCADCVFAQWGSDPKGGRGQACKQVRLLFILEPKSLLPLVIVAPPTSLKSVRGYFLSLTSEATPYYGVVTSFGLSKEKNADGIEYAKIVPRMVTTLSPDEIATVRAYAASLQPVVEAYKVEDDPEATSGPPPAASEEDPI